MAQTRHGFIYEIVNLTNGKRYIGSSVNLKVRWKKHLRDLCNNRHHSFLLQRAWNKYGSNIFQFNILSCVINCSNMVEAEQEYLDLKSEYNISLVAGSPRLGMKSSSKHCANMSKALTGRKSPNAGKKFTDEHKANIRNSMTGVSKGPMTQEAKLIRSQALKDYWAKNKGKKIGPQSEESRKNKSVSCRNAWTKRKLKQ